MKSATLPPSSYVVLGLLAVYGPMTPYDLKKSIDGSVGYFWSFPRAQLYVEPERLKDLGLLTEEREPEGRRRRTYSITEEGRATLREWLVTDTYEHTEIHDAGLLKLFFAQAMTRDEVVALARQQEASHRQRLAEYEAIVAQIHDQPTAAPALATLRMGIRYETTSIEYWDGIARNPPEGAPSSSGG
jgi:PadR family transcriptional regulator, regulatory protein AphA